MKMIATMILLTLLIGTAHALPTSKRIQPTIGALPDCGWRVLGQETNTRLTASIGDTQGTTFSQLSPARLHLYSSDIDPELVLREDGTGSIWKVKNSGGYLGAFQVTDADDNPSLSIEAGSGPVTIHTFLTLQPREQAPWGGFGSLYVDTSGALCFHNGAAWERIGGSGECT